MNSRNSTLPANLLRLGAGALGLAAVGVFLVQGSEAAFTASTDNKGNIVDAGTVVLNDDDASTAMFNVGNVNGGQKIERCINVTYDGSLTADIKLHGVTSGDLAPGLATTIELGTEATGGAAFDCTGFIPDGPAEFSGTLATFGTTHNDYANGIDGFNNAIKSTTPTPTAKSYKITMVVSSDNEYQGTSAGVDFTWEAQGQNIDTTTNRTVTTP